MRYFRGAVILILSLLDGVSWVHLIWVFLKILEYSFNVIVIPPALSDFLDSVMSLIQTYREQEWSLKHFCYINVCYSTHQKQCMKRKKSFLFFLPGRMCKQRCTFNRKNWDTAPFILWLSSGVGSRGAGKQSMRCVLFSIECPGAKEWACCHPGGFECFITAYTKD